MQKIDQYDFTWPALVKALLYLLGDYKKQYLFYLIIVFITLFYNILPPLVVGKIVDFFTTYKVGDSLTPFYSFSIFLGLSFSIVSVIRLSTKRKLGDLRTNIIYNIRVKGFENLLNLSWAESRKEMAGEKSQKIENGTRALVSIFEALNNDIFQSITTLIGVSVIFFTITPKYLILVAIYVLGFSLIIKYFYSRIIQVQNDYNAATEKTGGNYIEGLNNVLTIKALGAIRSFQSHVENSEQIRKKFEYLGRRYGIGQWITFQIFNGLMISVFLLFMGHDLIGGLISLGYIVTFYTYVDKLTGSASNILWMYESIISSKSAIGRMMTIFWGIEGHDHGIHNFPESWDYIQLSKVNYEYSGSNQSGIKNIDLKIRKGEKIGVVGATGSGRSTLGKVLIGLLPIDSGSYQIGNVNINEIKHEEITSHIGLVLQETEIFNLSFKDNITMLKESSSDLFFKAVKIAQLEDVLAKLPQGTNTLLGEKGYNLSGGERQRIGLARIICRDPSIIILDEATSSVDSKTEMLIQEGIEKELVNKTVIIIAHRVATLKNVNRIIVFEQGQIIESGTYKSLSTDKSSRFSHYYQEQVKSK